METIEAIYSALQGLNIEFKEYSHPPVYTCEEAEIYYKDIPGGVSKNLFLRNKKGNQHYLVVVESNKQVDLLQLSIQINDHKLGFASPERMDKYLKTKPGSVSPFGLIFDQEKHIKVIVDQDLLAHEQVHYHPNDNTKTVIIKSEDLKRFLQEYAREVNYMKL